MPDQHQPPVPQLEPRDFLAAIALASANAHGDALGWATIWKELEDNGRHRTVAVLLSQGMWRQYSNDPTAALIELQRQANGIAALQADEEN